MNLSMIKDTSKEKIPAIIIVFLVIGTLKIRSNNKFSARFIAKVIPNIFSIFFICQTTITLI